MWERLGEGVPRPPDPVSFLSSGQTEDTLVKNLHKVLKYAYGLVGKYTTIPVHRSTTLAVLSRTHTALE